VLIATRAWWDRLRACFVFAICPSFVGAFSVDFLLARAQEALNL